MAHVRKPLKIDGQWCCLDCKVPLAPHYLAGNGGPMVFRGLRCTPCRRARHAAHNVVKCRAHRSVAVAIEAGLLLPVTMHRCVDCNAPACDYDHRDYSKPLHVDPVCRRCNLVRGAGAGLPPAEAYLARA